MKRALPRTGGQLFRSPEEGFNGIPPVNISRDCFLGVDAAHRNGELWFYEKIKPFINSMYDVGADATFYTNFSGEVHYFEPVTSGYPSDNDIFKKNNEDLGNLKSYFNKFGLSNVSDERLRITWEAGDVLPNPNGEDTLLGDNIFMKTKRGDEYIKENNFQVPDFISTDTEGHEFYVLQGFGELLKEVKIIQFEYNSTWYSAGVSLDETVSYLKSCGFGSFSYLSMRSPHHGLVPMNWVAGTKDHYAHCNIICINENYSDEVLSWFGNRGDK